MIDTFMAVWNRYHRTLGIKLLLTWLLIGISLLSLLITVGMASRGSFQHHTSRTPTWHNRKTSVTTTALVGSERNESITATPDHDKGHQERPCVVKTVRKKGAAPVRRVSVIANGNIPRSVPTSPTPSPTPVSLPTMTPTATNEPIPTPTEDMPIPEPTNDDDNTPGWDPTDIILLPTEKTVASTITPTTAIATSTPTLIVSPTESDYRATAVSGFADGKAGHGGRKKTAGRDANNQGIGIAGIAANCLSNSVNMAGHNSGNIGELAFNAAIIVGSVLLMALLFYSVLCAVYVLKRKRELR